MKRQNKKSGQTQRRIHLWTFAQAQAAGPVPPPPKSPWESSAGMGLTLTRGNSRTLLFTANGLATRQNQTGRIGPWS